MYWDLEILCDEHTGKPRFGFGTFYVICLYGTEIWVSDPYGLIGRVQAVSPAWGVEGFDSFVLSIIASHHIATGTLIGHISGLIPS